MKTLLLKSIIAGASLVTSSSALATYTPISNGPTYSVGIPSSSSISSSSTGPLYFSLSAPSTFQWVGLGIGAQMAGATVFVMYQDGNGNVTISSRDGGQGHVEPQFDSAIYAGVELLEGSGVVDGVMRANVRCTTCKLDSTSTSDSSPWIAAWVSSGSPIDSTSTSYVIAQHDLNSYRQFTFDLSAASISSDTNPFVSSPSPTTSGSSASGTNSASSPSSTSGNSSGSSSGGSSSSSSSTTTSFKTLSDYEKAHGIIMATTIVLLFPLGAIFMRVVGNAMIHGILQVFSLCALICGFGLGIKLAQKRYYLYNTTHTIFGTVIVALFIIQPFLGLLQHRHYRKTQSRGFFGLTHVWYGRILIILGAINGGCGLKLAADTRGGEIAYGVVAGVMAVLYTSIVVIKRKGGGKWGTGVGKSGSGISRREKGERDTGS